MTETAVAPASGRRKEFVGRVVSNKMQKTVVVAVEKTRHHPLYKRAMRLTKKYYAHDEGNSLQVGDRVRIVETRPLSKLKRWRVAEVIKQSGGGLVEIADPAANVAADTAETPSGAASTADEQETSA